MVDPPEEAPSGAADASATTTTTELATFGAGCFWCVEAVLEQVDGVLDVVSGYMGGQLEDPSYEDVCTGETGHAEAVRVEFDPARVTYQDLLELFWQVHDPTQLNRQGADVGTQYRSVIFTHNEAQATAAGAAVLQASTSGRWDQGVVTEVVRAGTFWRAEEYHQQYLHKNSGKFCNV